MKMATTMNHQLLSRINNFDKGVIDFTKYQVGVFQNI